jgi:hypothetical protein
LSEDSEPFEVPLMTSLACGLHSKTIKTREDNEKDVKRTFINMKA